MVNRTCASPVQERNSEEKANRLWEVPVIMVNRTCIPPVQERFRSLQLTEQLTRSGEVPLIIGKQNLYFTSSGEEE